MRIVYGYLKTYPFSLFFFLLYFICWISLFDWFSPIEMGVITIGEWPMGPILAMPFCIIILLNAIFRKGHRAFYLIMAAIIILPFFILSLSA